MRRYVILLAGLFFGVAGISTINAQDRDREHRENSQDQVCVYHDNYYQGQMQCYRPGDEVTDLGALSRNISSIHVYGRARVMLFDGPNFRGNSIEFTSDTVDLARVPLANSFRSWNDRVISLRVTSDRPGVGAYREDRPHGSGICVYEHVNYQGRSECFDSGKGIWNMARTEWNERVASIRVFGDARAFLFTNTGYSGARLIVDRSIPDLTQLPTRRGTGSWSDQVSSIRIERGSTGPAYRYRDDR